MNPITYRVSYRHRSTEETATFYPTDRADSLEIAQQLVFDGEQDVRITSEVTGESWTVYTFPRQR